MDFKTTPFCLVTAKKIQDGLLQGAIKTMDGKDVRILDYRIKSERPMIAAAVQYQHGEEVLCYSEQGIERTKNYVSNNLDLMLEVPYDYTEYDGFLPKQYQSCMVKMYNTYTKLHSWTIAVCATLNNGEPTFFQTYESEKDYYTCVADEVLPLNDITLKLYGTTKSYEQLFV